MAKASGSDSQNGKEKTAKLDRRGSANLTFEKEPLKVRFMKVKRRFLYASSPSDSIANPSSAGSSNGSPHRQRDEGVMTSEDDDWTVEKIVVDGELGGLPESSQRDSQRETSGMGHLELDPSELADSIMRAQRNIRQPSDMLRFIAFRAQEFFGPRFVELEAEEQFQKEQWYNNKFLAWIATAFLYVNWVLYLIQNHSVSQYEKIAYYGFATFLTLPMPVFVGLNAPRRSPVFFQIWLMCQTWFWGTSEVLQMKLCGFYTSHRQCGTKDFLFMMTYAIALPAVALFALNQSRLYASIGAIVQFILLLALIIPDQKVFLRNVISFAIFMIIFITVHYLQEKINRRMFVLRAQMKVAYKALQKSQIAEKQAASSKRRFVSYIFHEVRVPLNSAMLAYQNLQSNEAFKPLQEDQAVEIHALEGSLTVMQQVLNDVLDLQRMDAGRFESSPSPFPFHTMIQSMLGPVAVAAAAKQLELIVELDDRIDQCDTIRKILGPAGGDTEGLWVVGDPLRLRQILSNLTSNAVKFTPAGGGPITVKTLLIHPGSSSKGSTNSARHGSKANENEIATKEIHEEKDLETGMPRGSDSTAGRNSQTQLHSPNGSRPHLGLFPEQARESVVIRIEVSDSGPGIRPSELQESRLFSPFAQTKIGLSQAGKGSGLGLAIVRQIVTLSGGRLGVHSRKNVGSTFWIEFGFRLASEQEVQRQQAHGLVLDSTAPSLPSSSVSIKARRAPILSPRPPPPFKTASEGTGSTLVNRWPGDSPGRKPTVQMVVEGTADELDMTMTSTLPKDEINSPPQVPPRIPEQQRSKSTSDPPPALIKSFSAPIPADKPSVTGTSSSSIPTPALLIYDPSPRPEPPGEPPLHVLVVDDDSLTRTLMTRMLTRLGCVVETASDGQQALDLLLGNTAPNALTSNEPRYFDLVSLDNAMPIMTGQDAVKRLRELGRTDFVVGATGNALKLDQIAYLEAGADNVLTKPIMIKDVKAILQIAMDRRRDPILVSNVTEGVTQSPPPTKHPGG